MSSGIGNLRIMRALGRVLQIEDPRQAPARLKTDELVPVINLDSGWAGYEVWSTRTSPAVSLAGIAGINWVVVGNDVGTAAMDPYRQTNNAQHEYAILGMRVVVTYDAAGTVTDEGQPIFVDYSRQPEPAGIVSSESLVSLGMVNTGETQYIHSWPMQLWRQQYGLGDPGPAAIPTLNKEPIWVPAGTVFRANIAKLSAGNFPANTTLDVSAFGVRCPKGMRPPGI